MDEGPGKYEFPRPSATRAEALVCAPTEVIA